MKQSKQQMQQRAAAERREAKARAHAAMMARHAERKVAIAQWEIAYEGWYTANCKGPRPIHPDDAGTGMDSAAFKYDSARMIAQWDAAGDSDLVSAAAELGIDIGVEAY